MIEIDGSLGEGGGQVLRTSLSLSLLTGEPLSLVNIRAGRARPGLLRQHQTAVEAAAAVGEAEVAGAELHSTRLRFTPRTLKGGDFHFAIGTAGSTTLVLQTVLPALLRAPSPSTLVLEGGTHNPLAPPFDFLRLSFLPLLKRMGARVEATLERPGFAPAGGGRLRVSIEPAAKLGRLEVKERGRLVGRRAKAVVARLPRSVGERELEVVRREMGFSEDELVVEELSGSPGPGNALFIELESELESDHVTEVVTGFGERGVPAEEVARRAVGEARRYLASEAPVGEHLADQLLLPMVMAGGGAFTTLPLSSHARTNLEVMARFVRVQPMVTALRDDAVLLELESAWS